MWSFDAGEKQSSIDPPSPNSFTPSKVGYNDTVSIPVTLEWEKVDNAKSYYVEIRKVRNEADIDNWKDLETTFLGYPSSESLVVDVQSLTNGSAYAWTVFACLGENGNACGSNCCLNETGDDCHSALYSSSIKMFVTNDIAVFNDVELITPIDEAQFVKPYDLFEWESFGATGFVFEIINEGGEQIIRVDTPDTFMNLSEFTWQNVEEVRDNKKGINGKLAFNTRYAWRVTPCWWNGSNTHNCGTNTSDEQFFTTSGGQMASIISPPNDIDDKVSIPVIFRWEDVPGVLSYLFVLSDQGEKLISWSIVDENHYVLDYPLVEPSTNYSWRIKACAYANANEDDFFCEDNWHSRNFGVESFPLP